MLLFLLRRLSAGTLPLLVMLWVMLGTIGSPSRGAGQQAGPVPPSLPGDPSSGEAASDLQRVLWAAGTLQHLLAERDYPAVLALAVVARGGASGGEEALDDRVGAVLAGSLRPGGPLERCRGIRDPVEGTLCSLEALTPLVPPSAARELASEGSRLLGLYLRPGDVPLPGVAGTPAPGSFGGEGFLLAPFQSFAESVLEDAWRMRERLLGGGGESGNRFDAVVAGLVGFPPSEAPDRILARVPELRSLVARHSAVASLSDAARDGEAVLRDYREFLASLSGSAGELLDGARGLEARGRGAVEWASQRSFVYLASRTAALAGLEAGVADRIREVGNAAVDLRREGSAFVANLAEMGQQAAMAALSGNVFTLAAGVASFFNLTPGALGAGAAGEVRALRGVVEGLQDEMGLRFDDLRDQLDGVFGTLDSRFDRLETLVAANHAQVREGLASLEVGLAELGRRVDRLESTLSAYMEAGFDRDHARTLVRCLEHRERYLPPHDQMEFPVFRECLTDFRTRGARDARDALLTDRTTPVDDPSLASALADLSAENLARRLPLVARAAEQRFGYGGMQGGRGGANPLEWGVAARAYLTMLRDWPEHAAAVAPGDLEALLATGEELQAILTAVEEDPVSGQRGVLYTRVLSHYAARLDVVTAEADELARRHQQAQLRRVDPASVLDRMVPGEGEGGLPPLPVPGSIASTVPQEVRTAVILALETPTLAYRLVPTDSVSLENPRRAGLFRRQRHDRVTHRRTGVEVELRLSGGRTAGSWSAVGPPVRIRVEEMSGAPGSGQVRSTRTLIPDGTAHFLAEIWPELARGGGWDHRAPSPEVTYTLERAIEEELRRHESASLNRVFSAVCRPDLPGPEMEGADRESALRIRGALEGLTAARAFLAASVALARGEVARSHPAVGELLHGPDGLLDRGTLCGIVAAGDSPLRVVWLEEEPRLRAGVLSGALAALVEEEVVPGGTAAEVRALVLQLRAALRLQRIRAGVAGG